MRLAPPKSARLALDSSSSRPLMRALCKRRDASGWPGTSSRDVLLDTPGAESATGAALDCDRDRPRGGSLVKLARRAPAAALLADGAPAVEAAGAGPATLRTGRGAPAFNSVARLLLGAEEPDPTADEDRCDESRSLYVTNSSSPAWLPRAPRVPTAP